jgi:hypothetical protein
MKTTNCSDPPQTDDGKLLAEMMLAGLQRLKISLEIDRREIHELVQRMGTQVEMLDEMITQLRQRQAPPQ